MREMESLKDRTRQFALRVIKLYCALPRKTEAQIIGKQLLRCGTSAGTQFREALRAKSKPDLISKIEGSLQELEETQYWLELLIASEIVAAARLNSMYRESEELISIFVTIVRNVKKKLHHS